MKKLLTIVTVLVLLFTSGCGNVNGDHPSTSSITVSDQVGREVTIEGEVETIVSGYYIATSMLIALGLEDKLVGVENEPNKRPIYELSAPAILDLPQMGTMKEFDLETCAKLDPDLVVLPFKLKGMATSLEELGIPVLFLEPESEELQKEAIELLGKVTNTEERAKQLNEFISSNVAEIATAIEHEEAPRVYFAGNSSLLSTAPKAMYQNAFIENAGGKNVAEELTDTYWAEVSYEQILTWNPEYIILASDAKYSIEMVLKTVSLKECDAIVNGNVYQIPSMLESWDSPVPSSVLGAMYLASILHKDSYSKDTYMEKVKMFYETFYDYSLEYDERP